MAQGYEPRISRKRFVAYINVKHVLLHIGLTISRLFSEDEKQHRPRELPFSSKQEVLWLLRDWD
jgi:hypothetical protein